MEEPHHIKLFDAIFESVSPFSPQIKSIDSIPCLISYLISPDTSINDRINNIYCLSNFIKENRFIADYFAKVNDESIYSLLINLYLDKEGTNPQLKDTILAFIDVLLVTVEIPKHIFERIYQELSLLYRNVKPLTQESLNDYLLLLIHLYGDTQFAQKPKNYFAFTGRGEMKVNLEANEQIIPFSNAITFSIAFKPGIKNEENISLNERCDLIRFKCSNKQVFKAELVFPSKIIIDSGNNKYYSLPLDRDEWTHLVFTFIPGDDETQCNVYFNRDNDVRTLTLKNLSCQGNIAMTSISFFDGFIGEVGSAMLMVQRENGPPGIIVPNVIQGLIKYPEGLWKKGNIDKIYYHLKQYPTIDISKKYPVFKKNKDEFFHTLLEDIIFIFTPTFSTNKIIEDLTGFYTATLTENAILHVNQFFQTKIILIGGIQNILPIAEMLLLNSDELTEDILFKYCQLICWILKDRKHNMNDALTTNFFTLLSLFIEKYPSNIFTLKILTQFTDIAKALFDQAVSNLPPIFFEHILLNEKILAKFNQSVHDVFWEDMLKFFCESDINQIECYLNIKKICLILRYYDEKKYTEMCCEEHYAQFNPIYAGNDTIMKPSMKKKLFYLKKVMTKIIQNRLEIIDVDKKIEYMKAKGDNIATLFSLLTLDLSPCLGRFVISLFIKAVKAHGETITKKLLKNNFGSIIVNTFKHSLLGERILILRLIFLVKTTRSIPDMQVEKNEMISMLKSCIAPGEIFFAHSCEYNAPSKDIIDIASHCVKNLAMKNRKCDKTKCFKYNTDLNIVFNERKYNEYFHQIYTLLINWAIGEDISDKQTPINNMNSKQKTIIDVTILEIIVMLNEERNTSQFTMETINDFDLFVSKPGNCQKIIENKVLLGWLLTTSFNHLNKNDQFSSKIYSHTQKIIIDIFIKSIDIENLQEIDDSITTGSSMLTTSINITSGKYPILHLESLYIWGNKIRNIQNDSNVLQFISEILYDISKLLLPLVPDYTFHRVAPINDLKKSIKKHEYNNTQPQSNKLSNYLKDTLLIFCTFLFNHYSFYKNDPNINYEGINLYQLNKSNNIVLTEGFISSMNFSHETNFNLELFWKDYKFFDIIYKKFSFIWQKENLFKGNNPKPHLSNMLKYEEFLEPIILNKDRKNIYLPELKLLCKDVKLNGLEIHTNLIKIMSISFTMIITVSRIQMKEVGQLSKWLKEYRHFLRFIIIASSNMTLINQVDIYNNITEKCIDALLFGISFLKEEYEMKPLYKENVRKTLNSLISFCFLIVEKQLKYIDTHKSILKISLKPARNNLNNCAVFKIFHELIVNNDNQPILTLKKLQDSIRTKNINSADELLKKDWQEALFQKKNLKERIENNLFNLGAYQNICMERYKQVPLMINVINTNYTYKIIDLIPLYETELERYSNNSFIGQKIKRNLYKKLKKQLFSWRGMWSDHTLFFDNINGLKMRMINHYTKYLSRPLLAPILDLDYYIPKFTNFSNEQMFRDYKSSYKYDLDIDKIIKTKIQMNYEEILIVSPRDNYLRNIYRKSNEKLANLYHQISNKLDFRKDNEFIDIFQKTTRNEKTFHSCPTMSTPNLISLNTLTPTPNNNYFGQLLSFPSLITPCPSSIIPTSTKDKLYFCCFVKPSHHIRGALFIEKEEMKFRVFDKGNVLIDTDYEIKDQYDDDIDDERKTCFGSFFVCHHKDKDLHTFTLNYENIKFFLRKRYYFKKRGLEIFTKSNKSYYFKFKEEADREKVINDILQHINEPKPIWNDLKDTKEDYDYIIGYEAASADNKKVKKVRLSTKLCKWANWEISTFELLMWLNIYSNRSFSDLSQYPVMPWILTNYSDSINVNVETDYRDLSLPMGMLEISDASCERKEKFLESYELMKAEEEEMETPAYHFGSHYSNPIYITNFLIRLFPFSHISVELQGHKFDSADRLFLSVKNAFFNSSTNKTDVRELIPEFYSLPEIFQNVNNLNLGSEENGDEVDDVNTPYNNNPHEFVIEMRKALENAITSISIQKWIDLIFGYKQRGKEGELAHNLFMAYSYEDQVDIFNAENRNVLLRFVEFGLTPGQTLTKECLNRNKKELSLKHQEITSNTSNLIAIIAKNRNDKNVLPSSKVLLSCFLEKDKIISIMTNLTIFTSHVKYLLIEKKHGSETIKLHQNHVNKFIGQMSSYYSKNDKLNKHVAFYNKGKCVALGGFSDGKLLLISSIEGNNTVIEPNDCKADPSPITSIVFDAEEEFIFCGNLNGNVNIFQRENDNWKLWKQIVDHSSSITHISYNNELNLWASSSSDGYVNIYMMPDCRIIRSILIKQEHLDYVFLSSCPLPSVIVFSSTAQSFHSYSINGKDLKKDIEEKTDHSIKSPLMLKDLFFNDYLAYIVDDNVIIRSLPLLDQRHKVVLNKEKPTSLTVSEDNHILYAISEDGNTIVILCDFKTESETRNTSKG